MTNGPRFFFYWIADGTHAFRPPVRLLTLADFDATGLTLVEHNGEPLLALLVAEVTGDEIYDAANAQGTLLDGSLVYADDGTISRMREEQGGRQLLLNRTGADPFSGSFGTGQRFPEPVAHVQTAAGRANIPVEAIGSGFFRFDPADNLTIMDAIATGDRFILAVSYTPAVDNLQWGTDALLWGTDRIQWAA